MSRHPFLLVRDTDYPRLRERAARSPWREMRERALHDAATLVDDPEREIRDRALDLARALSTTALAFVLDPDHADVHRDRIATLLEAFDPAVSGSITDLMRANEDKTLWTHAIPTGNAFVQGVLALDVVHDHLPQPRLHQLEAVLQNGPAAYFRDTVLAWHQGSWAARAIWPLYRGDEPAYRPVVRAWLRDTVESVSADGVFVGGPGYAAARWLNPDREHKGLFGDLLQHSGVLPDWYSEPRIRLLQEWLHGYAYTPFGVTWTFGDTAPLRYDHDDRSGPERAARYSRLAGGFAAARPAEVPHTLLSTYVCTDEPAAEPAAAPSRVFPDGGAWFTEGNGDPQGIAAVLLNLRSASDAHVHKETNAVNLAAYGEYLLRGGGYNGWQTEEQGFSWEYVHGRALAANVALFDYPVPTTAAEERLPGVDHDHVQTFGAGVADTLLTGVVDYARGASGTALPQGHHDRGLLFVHPVDDAAGFVVVFDELLADAETAQLVWHPASAERTASADGSTHHWTVQEFSRHGVELSVHLATPPERISTHRGITASWSHGRQHEYLVAHYPIGVTGRRRVVTVLFPHDNAHPVAEFRRIDRAGVTGCVLRQGAVENGAVENGAVENGGVEDTAFAAESDVDVHTGAGLVVRAAFGFHRYRDGRLQHVWCTGATSVLPADGWGLVSDQRLTVFLTGDRIRTTCPAPAVVTLHGAGRRPVTVDGRPEPARGPQEEGITLLLSQGEHLIEAG